MKICELEKHCGECRVMEYCGNGWGYCLCADSRFSALDEETYIGVAEKSKTEPYGECAGCTNIDNCDSCDIGDDARDHMCEQIADFVEAALQEKEEAEDTK